MREGTLVAGIDERRVVYVVLASELECSVSYVSYVSAVVSWVVSPSVE